jgi:hypothetical protein
MLVGALSDESTGIHSRQHQSDSRWRDALHSGREDVLAISAADAARQVRTHMAAFGRYRDTAVSVGSDPSGSRKPKEK